MESAWRNFKNIFSRPLFTIIFRLEMLKFHPYFILTGDTMVGFVIFYVLRFFFRKIIVFKTQMLLYEKQIFPAFLNNFFPSIIFIIIFKVLFLCYCFFYGTHEFQFIRHLFSKIFILFRARNGSVESYQKKKSVKIDRLPINYLLFSGH